MFEVAIVARNSKGKRINNRNTIPFQKETKKPETQLHASLLCKVGVKTTDELVSELPEEKRIELADITQQLEKLMQDYKAKHNAVSEKETKLNEGLNELKSQRESLANDLKQYHKENETLLKATATLQAQEQELAIQRANAEAGFLSERQSIFKGLQEQFDEIKHGIEEFQASRTENYLKVIKTEQEQFEIAKSKADKYLLARMAELVKLEEELKDKEEALVQQRLDFEQTQTSAHMNISRLEKRAELRFKSEQAVLEQQIEELGLAREVDLRSIQELSSKLSSYKELERQAAIAQLGGPKEFLAYVDQLKSELKGLRVKLQGRSEDEIELELEQYKDLYDEYLNKFTEVNELNIELRQKNAGHNISVREKLELQRQLQVLELHNGTLQAHITNLKSDLDELLDKQENKEAFQELLKMDRELISPVAGEAVSDLKTFVNELQHKMATVEDTILYYDMDVIRKLVAGLAMSHLHIFQGISGTGKTSIVKAFAKAMGGHVTTVPVQAGWRDRDDILGHYNAFEKRYYEKECLQGIYRAQTESFKNRINLVLLDEMNLSRPEQYFAEFLSALEMRQGEQEIVLMDSSVANPPNAFKDGRKILLSNNTWFMGTANHDETTFEFADKTHDRSILIELERQEIPNGWKPKSVEIKPVSLPSLQKLFDKVIGLNSNEISDMLNKTKVSKFVQMLESKFAIGWGSRFEKQAIRFMSVFVACSDDKKAGLTLSLEHLLSSRIVRKGKVLGRFDIRHDDIEMLSQYLETLFNDLELNRPDQLMDILDAEAIRKAEGAY